jgi:hypothetical protein
MILAETKFYYVSIHTEMAKKFRDQQEILERIPR